MINKFKDLFLYGIVGGIATLTEWLLFFLMDNKLSLHYLVATIIAYIIATFVNWLAGRILVFKESTQGFFREIASIYITGILGLGFNLIIMWVMVDCMNVHKMLSKVVATVIVFMWNYLVRKLVIYRHEN